MDPNKRYSRIGFENDLIYVCEPGKLIKQGNALIVVRNDNTAIKSENRVAKNIPYHEDYDEIKDAEEFDSEAMPIWAARFYFKIDWVSYPIKIQDLSETQIKSLGFYVAEEKDNSIIIKSGEEVYTFKKKKNAFKEVMKLMWNVNYGNFKRLQDNYVCYRYDDEKFEIPNSVINRYKGKQYIINTNPNITYYRLIPIDGEVNS